MAVVPPGGHLLPCPTGKREPGAPLGCDSSGVMHTHFSVCHLCSKSPTFQNIPVPDLQTLSIHSFSLLLQLHTSKLLSSSQPPPPTFLNHPENASFLTHFPGFPLLLRSARGMPSPSLTMDANCPLWVLLSPAQSRSSMAQTL